MYAPSWVSRQLLKCFNMSRDLLRSNIVVTRRWWREQDELRVVIVFNETTWIKIQLKNWDLTLNQPLTAISYALKSLNKRSL